MLTVKRVLRYEHIKLWNRICVIRHRTTFKDKTQICERSSNALRCEKQRLLREKVSQKYPLVYNSSDVERDWYEWWQFSGYFSSQPAENKDVFSMILPPPNITGTLHLGHALTVTIQDVLVRWHRMRGKSLMTQFVITN